jgi:hypothetical protein
MSPSFKRNTFGATGLAVLRPCRKFDKWTAAVSDVAWIKELNTG